MAENKPNYKKTLNLPKTAFAMKANLVEREPAFQKRWAKLELYRRIREANEGRPRFVFHDGPPYANGSIHMGHLLNKVLKDLVVRSKTSEGFDTPYVPGWDCHGLPIEHKVLTQLGDKADGMVPQQIRHRCRQTAEKFVKLQSEQLERLGTLGDYAQPYLTMDPQYEAATLEVFAKLVERGLVFRALRPVHWSIANRTALADAELEYRDRTDVSVFVSFEVSDPARLPPGLEAPAGEPVHVMIWTTTPWTLPANLAVAVSPSATYRLYRVRFAGTAALVVVAESVAPGVLGRGESFEPLGSCSGAELVDAELRYRHPFIDREGVVVGADYVTLDDGTGLVHTAPGHGADDFNTGKSAGLEIYCPVREDGTYDASVPEWLVGRSIWDANDDIVERLRGSGHLFHAEPFEHSYPHDWRSKTPVIFRATEQWFVAVDGKPVSLRKLALEQTAEDVRFTPEWGRNRMRGMLESRPDWCISRQRAWGLPIPAFYGENPGEVLLTAASVRAVADTIGELGSDAWFDGSPEELLRGYDPATDSQAPDWVTGESLAGLAKGNDIFDVWFESGSSWHAVAGKRGFGFPVDLYLEGSDQHRGWFQLSLLLGLGYADRAPFRALVTHGFVVDRHGMKMSKSVGNTLEVADLVRQFGSDIARWWVCSLNFEHDIKVDVELIRLAGEEYRKVRNTIRFLLSNIGDFDPARDRRDLTEDDRTSIDAWALGELGNVVRRVREEFGAYRFRQVHEAIFHFCNDTLSSVYLSAVKDRLYCDRVGSDRRRRTQTALFRIADELIRLCAPILVHTADEAYLALHRPEGGEASPTCVHLTRFPDPVVPAVDPGWDRVMSLRERVLKALETARTERGLSNPLDVGVRVALPAAEAATIARFSADLADLCGVSRFAVAEGEESIELDDLTGEPRCERSWKRDGTVRARADGGMLSERDAAAVGVS